MLECYNLLFESENKESKLNYSTGDIESRIEHLIKSATRKNGFVIINHEDILKEWFPKTGCHIFLSHSHKDKELAIYIANKLYSKYGVKTFIDSQFWGFVDKAISRVTHELCKIPDNESLLDYDKSMRVASNFYLVLANALTSAIDQSDSCIFLNTENSLNASDGVEFATYSPWIYTELHFTSQVERRPHQNRPQLVMESTATQVKSFSKKKRDGMEELSIRFETSLEHTIKVEQSTFNKVLNGDALNNVKYYRGDTENAITFRILDNIYEILNQDLISVNNGNMLLG